MTSNMFRDYNFIDIRLAYIAGFFDGEGCITVNKPMTYCNLMLQICNTNKASLDFVVDAVGGHTYGEIKKKGYSTVYRWMLSGAAASELLEKLLPYLIIKKERAVLAIELPYATMSRRKEIARRIRELNQRIT